MFHAIAVAYIYASCTNSLASNGRWRCTKAQLQQLRGGGLPGATTFFSSRRTLAGGRLNLGRWHGYQEVLYHEPLPISEITFDLRLADEAYLLFIFDKSASGFSGLRVSGNELFESQFFVASHDGEFITSQSLQTEVRANAWMKMTVRFAEPDVSVFLDGKPLGDLSGVWSDLQVVGFRGCEREVLVDNVVIHQLDERPILSESFSSFPCFLQACLVTGLLLTLLTFACLLRVGRSDPLRRGVLFMLVKIGFVSSVCLAIWLVGDIFFIRHSYPRRLFAQDFRKVAVQTTTDTIRERYVSDPASDTIRILFVGTSQTWGAGAAPDADTCVEATQRLLNASAASNRRYECIAAAVRGFHAQWLLELYTQEWLSLSPQIVVLNLGSNDGERGDIAEFAGAIEEFIRLNNQHGIQTVISLEANSIEALPARRRQLDRFHAVLKALADKHKIRVIDLDGWMQRQHKRGLIWWDHVHPTSFGHRLMAEAFAPPIQELAHDLEGRFGQASGSATIQADHQEQ